MRRKRYLMTVDSVISAIKMGSSCEASCRGLSNQWHGCQSLSPYRPLQDETLQGTRQEIPTQNAHDGGVTGLFLPEICASLKSFPPWNPCLPEMFPSLKTLTGPYRIKPYKAPNKKCQPKMHMMEDWLGFSSLKSVLGCKAVAWQCL